MAPLTVLSDSDVKKILHSLTAKEVDGLQQALRRSLNDYSRGQQNQDESAENQPARTTIESGKNTTLFMPSISSSGIGIKVVTLESGSSDHAIVGEPGGDSSKTTPQGALTVMENDGKPIGFINAEEVTAFRTALASSLLMVRRSKVKVITVFGAGKQAYWHIRLALLLHGKTINHVNMISHHFSDRARDFYKSLIAESWETKKREGWYDTKFKMLARNYTEYERLAKEQIREADMIFCMTPSTEPLFDHTILTNASGRIKPRLIIAVGSYKPSMIEIPPEIIQQAIKHHGHGVHIRKRAEEGGVVLVDTIKCLEETGELARAGLEFRHVVELGEIVMLEESFAQEDESAIDDDEPRNSVDGSFDLSPRGSMAKALNDINNESPRRGSGAGSRPSSRTGAASPQTTSRSGSFSSLSRRSSIIFHRRSHGPQPPTKKQSKDQEQMSRWLTKGNVIYKSVGLGLMDLCVGTELVRLAKEKGVGLTLDDF